MHCWSFDFASREPDAFVHLATNLYCTFYIFQGEMTLVNTSENLGDIRGEKGNSFTNLELNFFK